MHLASVQIVAIVAIDIVGSIASFLTTIPAFHIVFVIVVVNEVRKNWSFYRRGPYLKCLLSLQRRKNGLVFRTRPREIFALCGCQCF